MGEIPPAFRVTISLSVQPTNPDRSKEAVMRLVATDQKANIKWFYVVNGQKYRYVKGLIGVTAWEVSCSCGWESHTGGGVRSWLDELVFEHKFYEHDYKIELSETKENK
jgi:hypothetical protein